MIARLAIIVSFFTLAVLVLFASVYRSVKVSYVFNNTLAMDRGELDVHVDYPLPEPRVSPGSPGWPIEILGEKVKTAMAASDEDKSLMLLEQADKRLSAAQDLYEKGNFNDSVLVFSKAEGYLMEALESLKKYEEMGMSQEDVVKQINLASLKHREMIEEVLLDAPDDARAVLTKTLDTPKLVYNETQSMLENMGSSASENPFEKKS